MFALARTRISTKLTALVGAALLALCAIGVIAVFAAREIQHLGKDLYVQSDRLARLQGDILVAIERAIGEVNSAPAELDLAQLAAKQKRFHGILDETRKVLKDNLTGGTASGLNGDQILAAVAAFETASDKVFKFVAAFAQPDAIAALTKEVKPAETTLHAAVKLFREASDRSNAAQIAAIDTTAASITWLVSLLAFGLVLTISLLGYVIVVRGVARPIKSLNGAMAHLSNGDANLDIPHTARVDEIGDMARAVEVFKQNAIDRARLENEQSEATRRNAAERKADMHRLADEFQAVIGGIVDNVSSASSGLEQAATVLKRTAETTQTLSGEAAAASGQASSNVQSVASATEEMTSSVSEISRQVSESSRIAKDAVGQAEQTDARINQLSQAASRIGDVVKMITAIAEQTNLLALNATIEAARAGEAGRGFAVVASEVKQLASQTAKATEEISAQIAGMQTATADSVAAIKQIGGTIGRIAQIAAAVATAVDEQSAATQEITRNVGEAARGTTLVANNVTDVNRGASETGSASSQVLAAAQSLSNESSHLKIEVDKFLSMVRAA